MPATASTSAVYLAGRDLAGFPVGTHLLIVLVTGVSKPHLVSYRDPNVAHASVDKAYRLTPRDLGDGTTYGIVAGAQCKQSRLLLEYFEASDYQAVREHYNWSEYGSTFSSDFDTEMHEAKQTGATSISTGLLIGKILGLLSNYVESEASQNIPYPFMGNGLNSNSFAQSVLEYAGCTVTGDYNGLDLSGGLRLPKAYFEPHTPGRSLPSVNGGTVSAVATPTPNSNFGRRGRRHGRHIPS